jgi:hypothetical protein
MLLLCISLLAGCTTFQDAPVLPKIGVQLSVGKFLENSSIERRAERADRVVAIAASLAALNETTDTSVPLLRTAALQHLFALNLSPTDQLLAWNVIDAVQVDLEARIRTGIMSGDLRLPVREVLQWVSEAASLFASPPPVKRPT